MDAIHPVEITSSACKGFPQQPPKEQRRLLHLLLERASWRDGQLETTFRQPFAALRLSNSATNRKDGEIGAEKPNLEVWLPGMDSNHDSRLQRPLSYH